jgi:hypothetical protein
MYEQVSSGSITQLNNRHIMANWTLSGCCDGEIILFLCLYGGYSLFTMFFMNTVIVKPVRKEKERKRERERYIITHCSRHYIT